MSRTVLVAFAAGLAVPIMGVGVALGIFADLNSYLDGVDIRYLCSDPSVLNDAAFRSGCEELNTVGLMHKASIWSGFVVTALLLIYLLAARICGTNRNLLSNVFKFLVPISMAVIATTIIVQGAIFVAAVYFAESYFLGQVHFVLIGLVGLGAVAGGFTALIGLFKLREKAKTSVAGVSLGKEDHPEIWSLVNNLAREIDARPPNSIVVGLEPTFYVTSAEVNLLNTEECLTGETLYLSLPLMRLLSEEEFTAVVAHELGHFKGEDLAYSMKFSPIYRGLSDTLASFSKAEGIGAVALLPAATILSAMLEIFARNERAISRIREHAADAVAVEMTSPKALGLGLAKFALFSGLWSDLRLKNADRLSSGKVTKNLSIAFEDSARYDIEHAKLQDVVEDIVTANITHPTDTHPSIGDRFSEIGFSTEEISIEDLTSVGSSSNNLIDGLHRMEESLSIFEHRMMLALGYATRPEEVTEQEDGLVNAIYTLAAGIIGADGKIEQSEVHAAEGIGKGLLKQFDEIDFRAYCASLEEVPDFRSTVDLLEPVLSDQAKNTTYEYLMRIASSDGDIASEEATLLKYTRQRWSLSV